MVWWAPLNHGHVLEPVVNTGDALPSLIQSPERDITRSPGGSGSWDQWDYMLYKLWTPGFDLEQSQNEALPGSWCCGVLWGRECPCLISVCLFCQAVTSTYVQQAGLCGTASEEHVWWGSDGELPGQWDAGAACLAGAKACWVSLSFEKQLTLSLCLRIWVSRRSQEVLYF